MKDETEKNNRLKPLGNRNAETAEKAIKDLYKKVYEALEVVQLQQKTISMLVERVGQLENALNLQKMNLTGLGPTAK